MVHVPDVLGGSLRLFYPKVMELQQETDRRMRHQLLSLSLTGDVPEETAGSRTERSVSGPRCEPVPS